MLAPVADLVEEVTSGDWGQATPGNDLVECVVVRATDFEGLSRNRVDSAPRRFLRSQSIVKRNLLPGDLLVEMSGGSESQPTGRLVRIGNQVAPMTPPLVFSNFVKRLRLKDSVDSEYFALAWRSLYYKGRTRPYEKRTTGIRNFQLDDFLTSEAMPLPPLDEQCRIARILSTILRSEGATADSLHAVQQLKVAFKRYCLDYPTESGTNVHLRDLDGAIETGPFGSQLHASEYERTGIRVLNPIHLCENGVNPDVEPVYVSEDTASRLSRHRLQKGDVVVPRRGDLSRYVLVRGDIVGELCGTGSIKVRLNDQRVSPAYFALYYGSEIAQSYIRDAATGTIMPNISPRVLEGMPIYLPEGEIQDRFVKGWEAIDAIERALVLHLKHIGLVFGASLSLLCGDDPS